MGLFRLLIILAIAFLAYRLFRSWQRSIARSSKTPKSKASKQVENVVRCHHCDLHIPEAEAIQQNGRYYCSQKHLQQDQEH